MLTLNVSKLSNERRLSDGARRWWRRRCCCCTQKTAKASSPAKQQHPKKERMEESRSQNHVPKFSTLQIRSFLFSGSRIPTLTLHLIMDGTGWMPCGQETLFHRIPVPMLHHGGHQMGINNTHISSIYLPSSHQLHFLTLFNTYQLFMQVRFSKYCVQGSMQKVAHLMHKIRK
jgi:hypothetical protein